MKLWLAVLAFIMTTCAGCTRPQQSATVAPVSQADLKTVADKIDTVNSSIQQVQTTVNQQTTNFSLDDARARVEEKRNRGQLKFAVSVMGILAAFVLLGFCNDKMVEGKLRAMLIVVAICVLGGSIGLLLILPW